MQSQKLYAIVCCLIPAGYAFAGSVFLNRTPLLSAKLTSGDTYEVELSTNNGAWNGTGVLVAGTGATNTVRLDGFPASASYRFSRIGAASLITPAATSGFHLGATFPGAGEVHFESRNDLSAGTWTNRAYAFTNFAGQLISPVLPPLDTPGFFRAVQPDTPLDFAVITYYSPSSGMAAGFDIVSNDMPQIYRDGFVAATCQAFYDRNGISAGAAGECYELAGSLGKTTVMVTDLTPNPPAGTCDSGRRYFDAAEHAFTNLFNVESGIADATYRLVPAPVTGNVKLVTVINSGGYYFELRPYNFRAGVDQLQVQGSGGSWTTLSRTEYNSFVFSGSSPMAFPMNVRVISRFGETVTFPAISAMADGDRFTANSQFVVFPDQGPSPVWYLRPVYAEGLGDWPGGKWTTDIPVNPAYTGDAYQGTTSLQITNLAPYGGVYFFSPVTFLRQTNGWLEFAIRAVSSGGGLSLVFNGQDASGAAITSTAISLRRSPTPGGCCASRSIRPKCRLSSPLFVW